MILISGCLSGNNAAYNGRFKTIKKFKKLVDQGKAVPVCPEILGGLSVPRERAEITAGTGKDVLFGKSRVLTESGIDVTANFINGAEHVLKIAKKYNVKKAILKTRSPACGNGRIYDGSFSCKLKQADGVTAAILKMNGIQVLSDKNYLSK